MEDTYFGVITGATVMVAILLIWVFASARSALRKFRALLGKAEVSLQSSTSGLHRNLLLLNRLCTDAQALLKDLAVVSGCLRQAGEAAVKVSANALRAGRILEATAGNISVQFIGLQAGIRAGWGVLVGEPAGTEKNCPPDSSPEPSGDPGRHKNERRS